MKASIALLLLPVIFCTSAHAAEATPSDVYAQAVRIEHEIDTLKRHFKLQALYVGTRVLLAEDEPVNREVSLMLLEEVGLVIDLAADGAEAVELAKRTHYALILMDMQMPHLNGVEATRAIRADSLNQATPILAMTANVFDEDRRVCLAAGMNDHISKPVEPDVLYETVLKWLVQPRA